MSSTHDAATAESGPMAVVERYFDGCNTGDLTTLLSTLDPGVIHYFLPADRPPIRGAEHLARFWAKMKRVNQAHWGIDHALCAGDEVVIEWTLYWTHPAGGLRLVNRGTEWHVLRDGLIQEIRAYLYFPATPPLIESSSELTGFPYQDRGYLVEDV